MVNDIEARGRRSRNRGDLGQRNLTLAALAGGLLWSLTLCGGGPAHARPVSGDIPLPVPRPVFPGDTPVAPTPTPPQPAPARPAPGPAAPSAATPPPVAPSGARLDQSPAPLPADGACLSRLTKLDLVAPTTALGPQTDARCTVADAVRLQSLRLADGGRVSFPDQPLLACATAEALALYIRDLLAPLAKGTFAAPLASVATGPGFECRSRDHIFGAKLSAHGRGLAVDIGRLTLANGAAVDIGTPKTPLDAGFQQAARAGGCGYFHTALGPGSDSFHATHWHFDLEARGKDGDSKYCR